MPPEFSSPLCARHDSGAGSLSFGRPRSLVPSRRVRAVLLVTVVLGGGCGSGSGAAVHTGSGGTPVDGSVIGGSHGGPGSGGSGNGGSRGSGGSGGAPPLTSAAGFGPAFEQAMCATLAMCGGYPDVATCKADTVFAEGSLIETTVTHVQQGLVRYDPTAAAACIAALPTDCETTALFSGEGATYAGTGAAYNLLEITPACFGVFTGLAGPGQPCSFWLDCSAAAPACGTFLRCQLNDACCPSTCQEVPDGGVNYAPHAVGEGCGDDGLCLLPSLCDPTSHICIVPPPEGASCDPTARFPCGRMDDYCAVTTPSGPGTCTRRLSIGSSCTETFADPCVLNGPCTVGTKSGQLTCQARQGLGSPCGPSVPYCPSYLVCSHGDAGTCAAPSPSPNCTALGDGGT